MKNLLSITLILFLCLQVKAQTIINTYAMQIGTWDSYTEDWDFESMRAVDLKWVFSNNDIYVNDVSESHYTTYGDPIDEGDTHVLFDAYDENDTPCLVSITTIGEYQVIIVIYPDIFCMRYVME